MCNALLSFFSPFWSRINQKGLKKLNTALHVLGQLCEIVIIDGIHTNDQSSFLVH